MCTDIAAVVRLAVRKIGAGDLAELGRGIEVEIEDVFEVVVVIEQERLWDRNHWPHGPLTCHMEAGHSGPNAAAGGDFRRGVDTGK